MSAHRIKIKAGRKARQQAASTSNSAITPSDILGSPAIDLDEDNVEFPFPPGECPWYVPTDEEDDRIIEKWRRSKNSARSAPRQLCASDMDAQAAPTPIPAAPTPAPIQPAPGQSTGPRSPEGKARSSHNAIKHGLTRPAGHMRFLPGENSSGHDRLILQFNEQFVPMTGAERECIREIVDSLWLARRARDLQTSLLEYVVPDLHALALYLRYETAHQRAHNAAIKTLLALQKDRRLRNQNHEKWEEPIIWGVLDNVVIDDPEPEMSAYSLATTSPASTDSDSSSENTHNSLKRHRRKMRENEASQSISQLQKQLRFAGIRWVRGANEPELPACLACGRDGG
jgi:hypothetical protein